MTDVAVREANPRIAYVNEAGVPEHVAAEAAGSTDVARSIQEWIRKVTPGGREHSWDVFGRRQYTSSDHPFAQMAQCASAVERDDVLSTLADVVEGLTFQKMRFELDDADQQDIWNQNAAELDLDSRMREMWRELFKVSQVCVGVWWDRRSYTVRTRPKPPPANPDERPRGGNRTRRKTFDIVAPTALTVFDPTKILPVGQLMFGRERLAYIADDTEDEAFGAALGGEIVDETVMRLVERRYTPTRGEASLCADLDARPDRLWLLRADSAFRHTLTRASYERFAAVRLRPVLPILELKQRLRESDRATLLGNTNFIVLVRQGTDEHPAHQAEIDHLQEQVRVVARLPVLVGDHRLSVDIVTPSTDNTLTESRYSVLDARLVFAALRSFQPTVQGGNSGGNQVSEMSRVVARGLESRRHQLARTLESQLFAATVARNPGVLSERPGLAFSPKRIALQFNSDIVNAVLKLRDRGDLSRETMLEELDYDQDVELMRRVREREDYDDVFGSQVPFSSPTANPFTSGNSGGRPPGVEEEQPRRRQGG